MSHICGTDPDDYGAWGGSGGFQGTRRHFIDQIKEWQFERGCQLLLTAVAEDVSEWNKRGYAGWCHPSERQEENNRGENAQEMSPREIH